MPIPLAPVQERKRVVRHHLNDLEIFFGFYLDRSIYVYDSSRMARGPDKQFDPQEALKKIPPSLRSLARKRGKHLDLRQEDIEMLKNIHFRGKRPNKEEDWELIFLFLKRILG